MEVIKKTKSVQYDVVRAYDGTEFSAEVFGSIDAAKEEAKKYESSAESIVGAKAMKILKPYRITMFGKPYTLDIKNCTDQEKVWLEERRWMKNLFDPSTLAIKCIAACLLTCNWSILEDTAQDVYVFKPTKQGEIDIVMQYLTLIKCPINTYKYDASNHYPAVLSVIDKYNPECNGTIEVGHTYLVVPCADDEATTCVDIDRLLSLWTEVAKDIEENY